MVNMSKAVLQKCVIEAGLTTTQFNSIWARVKIRTGARVKSALSAYNWFSKDMRKKDKSASMKTIAEKWGKLSDKKKKKFQKLATKDKERYAQELAQHEETMQESLSPEIKLQMELAKMTCKQLAAKCKDSGVKSSGNKDALIRTLVDYESASDTETKKAKPTSEKNTLSKKSVKELKTMCKKKGLKTSGKKQDLINYLINPTNATKSKSHPTPIITNFTKTNLNKMKVKELRVLCNNKNLQHDGLKKKRDG